MLESLKIVILYKDDEKEKKSDKRSAMKTTYKSEMNFWTISGVTTFI